MRASPNIQTKVHKFLSEHRLATLATVAETKVPNAAAIYYIVDKEFNIYFMTRIESRKFLNLEINPTVSMVITDETTMETVQLSGVAERIENPTEESANLTRLWTADHRNPNWPGPAVKLFEAGHSVQLAVVKVVPNEMTYALFKRLDEGHNESFLKRYFESMCLLSEKSRGSGASNGLQKLTD